jgi:hypothetical protein
MAGLSSRVPLELGQLQVLNEVLDDEDTGEFSLDDNSMFDSDYTRVITGLM